MMFYFQKSRSSTVVELIINQILFNPLAREKGMTQDHFYHSFIRRHFHYYLLSILLEKTRNNTKNNQLGRQRPSNKTK